jgi:hypothetical protein
MTELFGGRCMIRSARHRESFSATAREQEAVAGRINEVMPNHPPMASREFGHEVDIHHVHQAEQVIDNCQINREAGSELFVDLDPVGSNCPRFSSR